MCGIFGRMELGQSLDGSLCCRQTDSMRHRGPDSGGYLSIDTNTGAHIIAHGAAALAAGMNGLSHGWDFFLGHRRLAILDLSPQAAQPMGDPEGRYWLTFNGEIYNFLEIKRELASSGVTFRTDHSDTEVLLLASCT